MKIKEVLNKIKEFINKLINSKSEVATKKVGFYLILPLVYILALNRYTEELNSILLFLAALLGFHSYDKLKYYKNDKLENKDNNTNTKEI